MTRRSAPAALALFALAIGLAGCGRLKAPPLELQQRDSLVGAGKIVHIENTSNVELTGLEVTVEGGGESRTYRHERLEAYGSFQVGWKKLGGWQVPDDARVRVRCEGYLLPFRGRLGG